MIRDKGTEFMEDQVRRERHTEDMDALFRHAPMAPTPEQFLHDHAARLLRAAERVAAQYEYQTPTREDGRAIYPPHPVADEDMVALVSAVRAAKGLVGR